MTRSTATTAPAPPRGWRLPTLLAGWRRRRELQEARREADAELLVSEFTSPRTAWRADELTSMKNRLAVACAARRVVASADARKLPGPAPLNRVAVREQAETLENLARLLSGRASPVSARGVLLLDRLLSDGDGPLFVSYRAVELRDALDRVRVAMQVEC